MVQMLPDFRNCRPRWCRDLPLGSLGVGAMGQHQERSSRASVADPIWEVIKQERPRVMLELSHARAKKGGVDQHSEILSTADWAQCIGKDNMLPCKLISLLCTAWFLQQIRTPEKSKMCQQLFRSFLGLWLSLSCPSTSPQRWFI